MARGVRVLVLSPYPAVRAGLSAQSAEDPEIHVAGQVAGSAELADGLASARPDVVLADPVPGDLSAVVDRLAARGIGLALLGGDAEGRRLLTASDVPGWALLPRDAEASEIAAACRAVAEGMIVFGRGMLAAAGPTFLSGSSEPEAGGDALTARERQVLQLLADGLPNKVIAARLSVSLHTVKFHVASILSKLGVSSRTEAVTSGARRGLVTI